MTPTYEHIKTKNEDYITKDGHTLFPEDIAKDLNTLQRKNTELFDNRPVPEVLKSLFHKAWGDAHDSSDYDKKVWISLQAALQEKGIDV